MSEGVVCLWIGWDWFYVVVCIQKCVFIYVGELFCVLLFEYFCDGVFVVDVLCDFLFEFNVILCLYFWFEEMIVDV